MKILFLSLLFLISCEQGSGGGSSIPTATTQQLSDPLVAAPKQVSVVSEVQEFVMEINEFLIAYKKLPAIDNLIVEFTDSDTSLETRSRGYCDKTGPTPKIVLYRHNWDSDALYPMPYDIKRAGFYHLIGHCVFNKNHNDNVLRNDFGGVTYEQPVSFMHSDFGYHRFPPQGLNIHRMTDLQREFFDYYGSF